MTPKVTLATMMIRALGISCFLAGGAALLAGSPALAQEPKPLGEFQDWAAYTYDSESGPVCYAVSQPTDWEPKNVNRGPIFFLITHRPSERVRNEVNTIIGYPFREDSTATVTVGDAKFELFTSGDGAWADTAERDRAIVEAMKAARPCAWMDLLARHEHDRSLLAHGRDRRREQDRRGVQVGTFPRAPACGRRWRDTRRMRARASGGGGARV
jgi:hypothetical protein